MSNINSQRLGLLLVASVSAFSAYHLLFNSKNGRKRIADRHFLINPDHFPTESASPPALRREEPPSPPITNSTVSFENSDHVTTVLPEIPLSVEQPNILESAEKQVPVDLGYFASPFLIDSHEEVYRSGNVASPESLESINLDETQMRVVSPPKTPSPQPRTPSPPAIEWEIIDENF